MPDDPSKIGQPDRSRININQPHEVSYWCGKWGVTEETLIAAVNAVGDSVEAVREYLGK